MLSFLINPSKRRPGLPSPISGIADLFFEQSGFSLLLIEQEIMLIDEG